MPLEREKPRSEAGDEMMKDSLVTGVDQAVTVRTINARRSLPKNSAMLYCDIRTRNIAALTRAARSRFIGKLAPFYPKLGPRAPSGLVALRSAGPGPRRRPGKIAQTLKRPRTSIVRGRCQRKLRQANNQRAFAGRGDAAKISARWRRPIRTRLCAAITNKNF